MNEVKERLNPVGQSDVLSIVIAETLVRLRERRGLTQQELADFLGWPAHAIARIESCERVLQAPEFFYAIDRLEEDPDSIFGEILQDPPARNFMARASVAMAAALDSSYEPPIPTPPASPNVQTS